MTRGSRSGLAAVVHAVAAVVAVVAVVAPAGGCSAAPGNGRAAAPPDQGTRSRPGTHEPRAHRPSSSPGDLGGHRSALVVLAGLRAKGRAPMTGYDRARYGQEWADADRNGCDTRNDVLARDLDQVVLEPGTQGCVVRTGVLADPYTSRLIPYDHGDGTQVDIDHVVSLGNAWTTGAFGWEIKKRAALANDPMNLLAVDASANRSKSDGDAATWLPPAKGYRCRLVARQIAVKAKFGLWVTPAEGDAMRRVLSACPGERVPRDSGAPVLIPLNVVDPWAEPGSVAADGSFASCDAARAAGAAPVHRGDAGYGAHLDGDGDGTACE